MNVKTEARENTASETQESHHGGHPAQQSPIEPKAHGGRRPNHPRRGSWLALVAMVAGAGLATAAALEASDGSSKAETIPAVSEQQLEGDRDFHREPPQASSYDSQQVEQDRDFHREPPQASTVEPQPTDWDRDFHRDPDDTVKPYGSGLPHEAH